MFFFSDLKRLQNHDESQVYRQRRTKVLTNLQTRREAEAKLAANAITPEEFLLAMSFHNESQIVRMQTQFRQNPSSAANDPVSEDLYEDSSDDGLCVICVNVKQGIHAFFPCRHAIACKSCCDNLFQRYEKPLCPNCRKPVETYHSIILNH